MHDWQEAVSPVDEDLRVLIRARAVSEKSGQFGRKFLRGLKIGVGVGRLIIATALFLAVFSFVHPVGDSLSVVQVPCAILGLFLAVFRFGVVLRFLVLVTSILALGQATMAFLNSNPAGPVVVYQKNLLQLNRSVPREAADIIAREADIVTLQEVTDVLFQDLSARLREGYPTRVYCRYNSQRGTAVFSKWEAVDGSHFCALEGNLAGARLETERGVIWALALHLHWPWPYEQGEQVPEIVQEIEKLDGPIVLGGDFNMLPWSNAVSEVERATRGQRAGGVEPTFYLGDIPLPIDHVMAPGGGTIEVLPKFGSDHYGLLARVNVAP